MREARNILFWGAIWGVLEATLGWGLHLVHFKGEALVLYPFGLACMLAAARQCGGSMAQTVLKVAAVAATVKLVNLFTWPGVPTYYVTNPAIAIFLEGLVTFAFCSLTERKKRQNPPLAQQIGISFSLVLGSFIVFKGWQIGMDALTTYNPDAHLFISQHLLGQWLWKSGIQAAMLVIAVQIALRWEPSQRWQIQTVRWSFPALIVAILTTYCL